MPETAVYEDNRVVPWQHNVRRSREIAPVEAETVAHPVQGRADPLFGPGILAPDPGHVPASMCGRDSISHRRRAAIRGGLCP